MRPIDEPWAYLWDMLDAARAVQEFVAGRTYEEYLSDRQLRGAVERHIEIIGEAAGRLTVEFREQHPEIAWHGIIGQRHVIAHGYGEIEHVLIWRVATQHIPVLISQLAPLVPPESTI